VHAIGRERGKKRNIAPVQWGGERREACTLLRGKRREQNHRRKGFSWGEKSGASPKKKRLLHGCVERKKGIIFTFLKKRGGGDLKGGPSEKKRGPFGKRKQIYLSRMKRPICKIKREKGATEKERAYWTAFPMGAKKEGGTLMFKRKQ